MQAHFIDIKVGDRVRFVPTSPEIAMLGVTTGVAVAGDYDNGPMRYKVKVDDTDITLLISPEDITEVLS